MKSNYITIFIVLAVAAVCYQIFIKTYCTTEKKHVEYKRGETKTTLTKGETVVTEKWRAGEPVGNKQSAVSSRQAHEAVKVDVLKFADDNLKLSVTLKQDSAGITVTPNWEVKEKTLERVDTLASERVDTLSTTITLEAVVPFYNTGWFRILEICVAVIATVLLLK